MVHTIAGNNFHGRYSIRVRAPAVGGRLSAAQSRRINDAMCGISGCCCGGGYGDGPDPESATLESGYDSRTGDDYLILVPAK